MAYTEITMKEMRKFLNPAKGWQEVIPPDAKEVGFDFPVKSTGSFIRVWSSIPATTGVCRQCGGDAIRVVILDTNKEKGLRKFSIVTRQENWQYYLKERIMEAFKAAQSLRSCPDCGSPMALREPKRNQKWQAFWGCSNYPKCKKTVNA